MRVYLAILFISVAFQMSAQAPSKNWFHSNETGVASEAAYDGLLNDRASTPVIVAVIDSGVDIEHEDLVGNIWVNSDEIPGNGIDDDKNGYIDDVNGWNFIGGANGENVGGETLEVTRLYAHLRPKYEDADPQLLNKEQLKEYNKWLKYKDEVEKKRNEAKSALDNINMQRDFILGIFDGYINEVGDVEISPEYLDTTDLNIDPQFQGAMLEMVDDYKATENRYPTLVEIKNVVDEEVSGGLDYFNTQYEYQYNPDFKSRAIIGDDYSNQTEMYYGNNDVEGPDAFHGTHVSGIIGAVRGNGIGMDGVAANVKIMSVRTVPDGDEHDKDVANAIRYAVDNGADIINMSFGKGYAWNKQVVDDAVRHAEKNDVLLVHAAGNSAQNSDVSDNFPNDKFIKPKGFLFWKKKYANNWLSIGALNYKGGENSVAPFSNYGSANVDVFAPGMAIYSTTPDNNYQNAQGTSMASPVVAGICAVIRSYYPTLTAKQIKSVIMESATPRDIRVKKPGADELANFNELSVTGGVANLNSAVKMASKIKGKRKIKKKKVRA